MSNNCFGKYFTLTTFGESHGAMIGGVIDGCPSDVLIDLDLIAKDMARRRPGQGGFTSPRVEEDHFEIVSGIYEGKTTGAPIAFLIKNKDYKKEAYTPINHLYRPGHATFTYHKKYGHFDPHGGGRASARETAVRVAAGAIAKQVIQDVSIAAEVVEVGGEKSDFDRVLQKAQDEGDSLGAIIECRIEGLEAGIGEPVYDKLEARLAYAMMSLPATKGFEIGSGFKCAKMKGSEHNDLFDVDGEGDVHLSSNNHGGTLGGISTGEAVVFRVAFKPTSSIKKAQNTVDMSGNKAVLDYPKTARHDVCVALRAPVIVEAMAALSLCDLILINRCSKNFS